MLEQRIKELIAEQLGVPEKQVVKTAYFSNLGADSVDVLELLMALEEEFGIQIPSTDAYKFLRVQDLIQYILSVKKRPFKASTKRVGTFRVFARKCFYIGIFVIGFFLLVAFFLNLSRWQ